MVLVPNLGSTSIKCQLLDMPEGVKISSGRVESIGSDKAKQSFQGPGQDRREQLAVVPDHRCALQWLLAQMGDTPIEAVGLKAVHGGPRFVGSVPVTGEVLAAMKEFTMVAPVHNPLYVEAIEIISEELPGTPIVAVFETGFHRTVPESSYLYGLPYHWSEHYGVRRYGFHGASHRHVSQRVPEVMMAGPSELRLVSCHLGGSSSVCALKGGQSVGISSGFSPQSGIEHGRRCGDVDPFAILYLLEKLGLSPAELSRRLCQEGGLLGISGVSDDMREIEEAAAGGNRRAALAIEVFVSEIRQQIGGFAALMGGLNALAFTGGIGEHDWHLREQVCSGLAFLGIRVDSELNRQLDSEEGVVSTADSSVTVAVIRANEELIVARETLGVLMGAATA